MPVCWLVVGSWVLLRLAYSPVRPSTSDAQAIWLTSDRCQLLSVLLVQEVWAGYQSRYLLHGRRFGGLLAAAISQMDGLGGKEGWAW